MTPLFVELNRWLALPHLWGETDCIMLCADWVMRCGWPDPADGLRMTYGTAGECERVTRFFTRPLDLVGVRMAAAGLRPVSSPAPGDVGLLLRPQRGGSVRPYSAVCLGASWAAKAENGAVDVAPAFKVLAVWGVGYAHP